MQSFKLKFLWVTILQGVEFPISYWFFHGPYNSAARLCCLYKERYNICAIRWRTRGCRLHTDASRTTTIRLTGRHISHDHSQNHRYFTIYDHDISSAEWIEKKTKVTQRIARIHGLGKDFSTAAKLRRRQDQSNSIEARVLGGAMQASRGSRADAYRSLQHQGTLYNHKEHTTGNSW